MMYSVPFKDTYGYAKKIAGSYIYLYQDSLCKHVGVHRVYFVYTERNMN